MSGVRCQVSVSGVNVTHHDPVLVVAQQTQPALPIEGPGEGWRRGRHQASPGEPMEDPSLEETIQKTPILVDQLGPALQPAVEGG